MDNIANFKIFQFYGKIKTIRDENSKNKKISGIVMTLLFPVFIVFMAELNQGKYPEKLISFIFEKPMIMVFNIAIASVIFAALCLILKKIWRAVAIQGVVYFALSITELFKYGTNGNHLIMTDMKLFKSVKSLTSFAYIKITPLLVIYTLIVIVYIACVFWLNPQLKSDFSKRVAPAFMCIAAVLSMFFFPAVSSPVYSFFKVDTTSADNVFILNEKFENNSFLAFFVQTASENISNKLRSPENYTEDIINEYLDVNTEKSENDFKKPNVIVVMSEAYADFRVFDELNVSDDNYAGFDRLAKEGKTGKLIVPTFASYTVKTEFELLFGLPVKSLGDPSMPQRMLANREQPTIVRYYKSLGYNTAYVHPFLNYFYSRAKVYSNFGFDQMIFQDDFTVPVERAGSYITDETLFEQVKSIINESDEPVYIHATTMQNHQPYNTGIYDSEFDNYLANIKLSADAINDFADYLSTLDEPVLLFITGDHFPSFKNDENNLYNKLNIDSSSCDIVFEQNYYLWSNYGQDFSSVPENKFSAFYVPYVILDILDAPKDQFIQAMTDKMKSVPIYSTQYDSSIPSDEEFDVLTYDRVIGENISDK